MFVFSEASAFVRFADDAQIPQWAITSVDAVREREIMTGFSDRTFRPNKSINRAEALTILFRVKGIDVESQDEVYPTEFYDVSREEWFAKAVGEAVKRGWITGFRDGTFRPAQELNRAEWAALLTRAFELTKKENPGFLDIPANTWYTEPVMALAANDLIRVKGQYFSPSEPLTRAEAAWTLAQIINKPRLSGTSKNNTFSTASYRGARQTAMKRRNFNPNLQGYDIPDKGLLMTVQPREDQILLRMDSDWTELGTLKIENTLDDKAELHALEFKLRFKESNVGPAENFIFRIEGDGINAERTVGRTGNIFISGLRHYFQPGEVRNFTAFLKPKSDGSFYRAEGDGEVVLFQGDGSMISQFQKDNSDRQGNYRNAPVQIEWRNFTPLHFQP